VRQVLDFGLALLVRKSHVALPSLRTHE